MRSAELVEWADIIFVMVPDTPHVADVLFSENGVGAGLSAGKTVVDMSSISPIESWQVAGGHMSERAGLFMILAAAAASYGPNETIRSFAAEVAELDKAGQGMRRRVMLVTHVEEDVERHRLDHVEADDLVLGL